MRFPRIRIVKELPQWIISSHTAAYVPVDNTIYLRKPIPHPFLFAIIMCKVEMVKFLLHELGHWLGFQISGNKSKIHKWLDGGKEPNFH